jgi:hypothetical protein
MDSAKFRGTEGELSRTSLPKCNENSYLQSCEPFQTSRLAIGAASFSVRCVLWSDVKSIGVLTQTSDRKNTKDYDFYVLDMFLFVILRMIRSCWEPILLQKEQRTETA